jgi:hypothetical protein
MRVPGDSREGEEGFGLAPVATAETVASASQTSGQPRGSRLRAYRLGTRGRHARSLLETGPLPDPPTARSTRCADRRRRRPVAFASLQRLGLQKAAHLPVEAVRVVSRYVIGRRLEMPRVIGELVVQSPSRPNTWRRTAMGHIADHREVGHRRAPILSLQTVSTRRRCKPGSAAILSSIPEGT